MLTIIALFVKKGFFPLDKQLELWDKHWSPELSKQIVWLSGVSSSFEKAEETLKRIGRVNVSDSSVWRQVETWGPRFQQLEEEALKQGEQPLDKQERKQKVTQTAGTKGVAMDGATIYIRDEGWKELKVGCTFDVEIQPTKDKDTGRWQDKAHAVNNQYVAYLGGPEQFGKMVWGLARRSNWFGAKKSIVLGDGAVWIWKLADHHFVKSEQLVDWYHATEHLGTAARLLYGEDDLVRDCWYEAQKTQLFIGQAEKIAQHLEDQATDKPPAVADALESEAGYFVNNYERMAYQTLQSAGYPIGSGMVESGCKQFKARFDGPGMRWSRPGAERLLPIRAAVMSNNFDTVWEQVYHLPQN
ncbi:MAG TPA: ISKra4 family transposase [Chloroflexi bacterium]|nr:ISKra4 family transposase [Chloroflexota bacterium]